MKRITGYFILLCVLLLPGCALLNCKPVYVDRVHTVVQQVPEGLLTPCTIPKLVNKDQYVKSDLVEQNDILVGSNLELMATIKECDSRLAKIKGLNNDSQQKTK